MNKQILDLATTNVDNAGAVELHGENLEAIREMVTGLLHDMINLKGDVSPQVQYFVGNYSATLRVIDLAFQSVMKEYHVSVQELVEDSEQLAEQMQEEFLNGLDDDTKAFYEAHGKIPQSRFELDYWKNGGIKWMTPERDREIAIQSAKKAFVKEFGVDPSNDEEALNWHQEKLRKKIAEIDASEKQAVENETEKADAPTSTNEI